MIVTIPDHRRRRATHERLVVLGDFNAPADSQPLPHAHESPWPAETVIAEKIPNPADRWTYHCRKATSAIDYILASQSLNATRAGIERRSPFGAAGATLAALY